MANKHFSFLDYFSFVEDDSSSYEVGVTDAGFSYLDMASEKKRKLITFEEKQNRATNASLDGSKRAKGQSNIDRIDFVEPDEVCFDTDLMAILRDIDIRRKKPAYLPWAIGVVVFLFLAWFSIPIIDTKAPFIGMFISGLFLLPGTLVLLVNVSRMDHSRRDIKFSYRIEGKGCEAFQKLNDALEELNQCRQVLVFKGRRHFQDTRYSGGDANFPDFGTTELSMSQPPLLDLDFNVWHLRAFQKDFYFMPDHILVYQGAEAGGVSYEKIKFTFSSEVVQVREQVKKSNDAEIVGHTWRYVNNDGTPDQRFNGNIQIPKLKLGIVKLDGAGIELSLYTSNYQVSTIVPQSFSQIQDLGRRPAVKVAKERKAAAILRRKKNSEPVFEALLESLCCIMLADQKVSKVEAHKIRSILQKVNSPWEDSEVKKRIQAAIAEAKHKGLDKFVQQASEKLAVVKSPRQRSTFVKCFDLIVSADGRADDREVEIRNRFASILNV